LCIQFSDTVAVAFIVGLIAGIATVIAALINGLAMVIAAWLQSRRGGPS
jgi:formate hydrogenlyase subunit 4